MKKVLSILSAGIMILGLTACSGEGSPLSKSSAKSALKKEAFFAKDSQVAKFSVGFQEVDEEQFNKLAQLKAAGMVDYTVEHVVEYRDERVWGGYWAGYYNTVVQYTHVFANVTLTQEGQKFVIAEPTELRKDLIDDFKANENYKEAVPDFLSAYDDTYRRIVAKSEQPAVEEEVVEEEVVEPVAEEVTEEPAKPAAKKAEAPANKNAAYEAMLARVNAEVVNVLLGHFELVKVRDVLCTEDMFKAGKGSCKVIYKFVDKTPFGYVLGAPKENYLMSGSINFIYYQDLGWTVDE